MLDYSAYKALSFDTYGTLIDWETGILTALQPWAERQAQHPGNDRIISLFGEHERAVQSEHPAMLYPDVLALVLPRIAASCGVDATDEECRAFGTSVGDWPVFEDTVEALQRLKKRFGIFILSNVDRGSFAKSAPKLGVELDGIVTAEDVGSYKPNLANFDAVIDCVESKGIERGQLLHVGESLFHDVEPARAMNMDVVWINRRGQQDAPPASGNPTGDARPSAEYPSMRAFAEAAVSV